MWLLPAPCALDLTWCLSPTLPTAGPCCSQRVSTETRVIKAGLRAKSRESESLQENLSIWDTPGPDDQPETQRGEMPWKGLLIPYPGVPHPHSHTAGLNHIPKESSFPKLPSTHTGWHQLCSQTPPTLYTPVSGEIEVRTNVFTLSPLKLKEKCFSTDGRDLEASDGLSFKTNPRSRFFRWIRLSESQSFLCSEHTKTFLQGWSWEQAECCGFFKVW